MKYIKENFMIEKTNSRYYQDNYLDSLFSILVLDIRAKKFLQNIRIPNAVP